MSADNVKPHAGAPHINLEAASRQRLVSRILAATGLLETVLGVCVSTFLIMVILGIGGGTALMDAWVYHQPLLTPLTRIGLTSAWVAVMIFAIVSLRKLLNTLNAGPASPVLYSTASQWLRTPALLRPVTAAWWLILALAAPIAVDYLIPETRFVHPNATEALLEKIVPWVLLYASSMASNCNFLIGTAALTGSEKALKFAWRVRLLIDLGVTLLILRLNLPPASRFL